MPKIDLFSAGGDAGFDEGWVEGSVDVDVNVTGGVQARICHGIDLGVNVGAAAEANAHLRLLVLGARANAGVHARAGVRGQVTFDPNVFERFGVTVRIEAAAEIAARARLEIGLEAEYVAELAAQQIDGLALELFLAFLREIRVGGGVSGKVAYSAMAKVWMQASGRFGDDADSGFTIGGGYAVGLKGGYGMDYFVNVGFENPRRFFSTAVNLIVDEIVAELNQELPPGSDIAIELFRLLVPVGLHAAYDIGQKSISQGISTPEEIVRPFLVAFAEELQRYLVDKATEYAARLIADLIEEAIVRLAGQEVAASDRQAVEASIASLNDALSDGKFDPEDLEKVLAFGFLIAELAAPEMVERFRRPATLLWTAATVSVALRDVGELVAGGQVSVLGFGVEARARIRDMPPVDAMPDIVLQEYLQEVPDFDGTSLSFDHAMDYLVGVGVGPMLSDFAPELAALLDQLHRATGISPGNIVTFGIQGLLGGPVTDVELYVELKTFMRSTVDELVDRHVFAAFDQVSGTNPDAQLYMNEVARPTISLMVSFVFDQLDVVVDDPSVLGNLDYLSKLQSGLSALLYKIMARNIVVLEQIVANTVRTQGVSAMAALEQVVRDDDTNALMQATVDHIDEVLTNVSTYVPLLPSATGLSDEQLAAVQTFSAEMLNIGQEGLGDTVFTDARWNRRREALLTLMLSLDANFDWGSEDLIDEAVSTMLSCLFVPDGQAIQDLFDVHMEFLTDQANILLRRLPQPLGELVLALTAPQLEQLAIGARAAEEIADDLVGLAEDALGLLLEQISQAIELAIDAAEAVSEAITDAIDALGNLDINVLRPVLVVRGQANLRIAGTELGLADVVLDPIVDGFGIVLEGVIGVLGGLVNEALNNVRRADFITAGVTAGVADISVAELLVTGGGSNLDVLEADASADFTTSLAEAITGLFIPTDDTGPAPGLTITVPGPNGELTALGPQDIVEIVLEAVLNLVDSLPLIGPRLTQAYQDALQVSYKAQEPGHEAAVRVAQTKYDAVRGRDGTKIEIYSPTALETRPDRVYFYGPVVPLALKLSKVGAGWMHQEDGQRIQITVNGLNLQFPATAWRYDVARQELKLDSVLRVDENHLRPGLNVIEVSVANNRDARVRKSVQVLVDPDGPLPNETVSIDPTASQFDAPGFDHIMAYEEYVALRWSGVERLDISGWVLRDRANHRYVFGPVELQSGQVLRIRTGGDPSDDTATDLHWGRRRAVWNNTGDTVLLLDAQQNVRAQYTYQGSR